MTVSQDYAHPLEQLKTLTAERGNESWLHEQIDGQWRSYSCAEAYQQALSIAGALRAQGLEAGDRVAIIAKNSPQWMISDFAMMLAGLISVPIYTTAGEQTISYVLEHSAAKAILVGRLDSTAAIEATLTDIDAIALPDYHGPAELVRHRWQDMLQTAPLEDIAEPGMDDIATLVYTSGSTGNPKGVILSFGNLAASAQAVIEVQPEQDNPRVMSYLPMAHITERSLVCMTSLYAPGDIYFNHSLDTFMDDLRHAQPTTFLSVPRLWAKFQAQVLAVIPDEDLQAMLDSDQGEAVAAGIREKLGLKDAAQFGSGSAPISPGLLQWFGRIGIDIAEGWGMTETSGAATSNMPFEPKHLGTVGRALSCVDIKVSDDGEILVRGPCVFKEYYKNPQATAEAFTDGWFHTGDKGHIAEDGAVTITGRVKEQFKTAKGKYVAPVPIESLILALPYVEQAMVLGLGRAQPMAILVLSEHPGDDTEAMTARLSDDLQAINAQLESHCVLNCLLVAREAMTIENGLLTPTLKLKRADIEQHFKDYLGDEQLGIVWQ